MRNDINKPNERLYDCGGRSSEVDQLALTGLFRSVLLSGHVLENMSWEANLLLRS